MLSHRLYTCRACQCQAEVGRIFRLSRAGSRWRLAWFGRWHLEWFPVGFHGQGAAAQVQAWEPRLNGGMAHLISVQTPSQQQVHLDGARRAREMTATPPSTSAFGDGHEERRSDRQVDVGRSDDATKPPDGCTSAANTNVHVHVLWGGMCLCWWGLRNNQWRDVQLRFERCRCNRADA